MFKEEQQAIDQLNQLLRPVQAKFEIVELFLQLDNYTRFHSYRVKEIVFAIATLQNLSTEQLTELFLAAFLHDIGKVAIPDELLNKNTRLNEKELTYVRMHAKIGADMCAMFKLPKTIVEAIRCHHEYFNGAGYPFGLSATAIPLESRIIAVADALDVMLVGRNYSKPRSLDDAIKIMMLNSGSQFDPVLVNSLLTSIKQNKSAVWMKSAQFYN